ncbi:hypothetical protein SDC9_79641 [bioreactor metagenome]|uniref:Uncharacterized protein n=1 Tax=bioreactor metagenome TaxID=1076179 RepID=A0A644Z4P9_9ZZZZ
MDGGGEGGGQVRVHTFDDVVGNEHRAQNPAALQPCGKGKKIRAFKGFQRPLVHGNAGVGVLIVPVAGEVLENTAHGVGCHGLRHRGHIVPGLDCVLPKRAVIDEVPGVIGHIRHRGQIHVEAQRF